MHSMPEISSTDLQRCPAYRCMTLKLLVRGALCGGIEHTHKFEQLLWGNCTKNVESCGYAQYLQIGQNNGQLRQLVKNIHHDLLLLYLLARKSLHLSILQTMITSNIFTGFLKGDSSSDLNLLNTPSKS